MPGAPGSPPVPWLLSNPIYSLSIVGWRHRPRVEPTRPAASRDPVAFRARRAVGRESPELAGQVTLDYTLGSGDRNSQFAAAVARSFEGGLRRSRASCSRLSRPARVGYRCSCGDGGAVRWARSVYVDATTRVTRTCPSTASSRPIFRRDPPRTQPRPTRCCSLPT